MKDSYWGIIALIFICGICVMYDVAYAKEVVMMSVPVIAAVIRD